MVLAGGSFAASAWEVGVLAGLASAGVDLRDSDLFIGTSAGARVALHLAVGTDLEALFQQQSETIRGLPSAPTLDWQSIRRECAEAKAAGGGHEAILKRFGAIALKHASLAPADLQARRETMAAQLPVQTWPEKPLSIVALNAETGARRVFNSASGANLVDVMIATTASFGSPPALIDGQHYIDGGYHSSNNVDLASGLDEVIVLSLRAPPGALALVPLDESVASLRASGKRVTVIQPDTDSEAAMTSGSPGNPAIRAPIAKAGYQQGKRLGASGLSAATL
ncbi:MAG: patatin-like phospholipase family protein [Deltaproteobacteria bacterium]|nr:patatin-like phospholipase family protein [Deltaproteobacteria bacterium]